MHLPVCDVLLLHHTKIFHSQCIREVPGGTNTLAVVDQIMEITIVEMFVLAQLHLLWHHYKCVSCRY